VPYMLVVGDSEEESAQVAVRRHGAGDIGAMRPAELAQKIAKEA
jgi:threonyl-tRNA synthetase